MPPRNPPRPRRSWRSISVMGIELVKDHEKLRLKAYLPTPRDVWTIGYGHTKGVQQGDTCTEAQAHQWLDEDLDEAEAAVRNLVTVPLAQHQYDALVSLVFNIGIGAFTKSTLLQLLNAKAFQQAGAQFDRWTKQKGVVLNGLVKRRAQERKLFETGAYH